MNTVGPNKAVAAAGGVSIGGAVLTVGLWTTGLHPPEEVMIALVTVANAALAGIAAWLVPHGGTNA